MTTHNQSLHRTPPRSSCPTALAAKGGVAGELNPLARMNMRVAFFLFIGSICGQVGYVNADYSENEFSILKKNMDLVQQTQAEDRPKLSGTVLAGSCMFSDLASEEPDKDPYDKFTAIIPRGSLESFATPIKKEKHTTTYVVKKRLDFSERGNKGDCLATGYLLQGSVFKASSVEKGDRVHINFYLFPGKGE